MVYDAQSGHLGGSLSATDLLTYLYFEEMDIMEKNVKGIERNRFVLSKGHASPLLYAVLAQKGLLEECELSTFRKIDSKLQGHPNMNYVHGVDMTTGSLGQGMSAAVGMALANKIDRKDHRIYVLLGDGECEEGEVWEAAMAAAHYQLNNLCAIVDYNGLQIDGRIKEVMNPTPIDEKFKAFGWNTLSIDGHDFEAMQNAFLQAKECTNKPTMVLAHTVKGKGISFMEHNVTWHGSTLNEYQYIQAMKELEGHI